MIRCEQCLNFQCDQCVLTSVLDCWMHFLHCAIWLSPEVSPADLSAHAAKGLAKFKVPLPEHIFLHTEELPKGATGKMDKKGLRERYAKRTRHSPSYPEN